MRAVTAAIPFAVLALAAVVGVWTCGCNENSTLGGDYVWNQTLIYGGRLLYPVWLEAPSTVSDAHAVSAAALALIIVLASIFGPRMARVGALWIVLGIAPHVFIQFFTAGRYLYVAAPGLALLSASLSIMIFDALPRAYIRAAAFAAVPLLTALFAWYGYETVHQNRQFAESTAEWRRFHSDVTTVFPAVPPGTRVKIIGGPFQGFLYQLNILPAFAKTTWGADVTLEDLEPGSLPANLAVLSNSPYVAEYRRGTLVRLHGSSNGE